MTGGAGSPSGTAASGCWRSASGRSGERSRPGRSARLPGARRPSRTCLFCDITPARGFDVAYKDEDLVVVHDIDPAAALHLLVIPKAHIRAATDLGPEHRALLEKMKSAGERELARRGFGAAEADKRFGACEAVSLKKKKKKTGTPPCVPWTFLFPGRRTQDGIPPPSFYHGGPPPFARARASLQKLLAQTQVSFKRALVDRSAACDARRQQVIRARAQAGSQNGCDVHLFSFAANAPNSAPNPAWLS
ncbi:MAG: hypothetical protein BJ554DRAFT_935 [Olpidium bornovanus]|uniref:HIT domain-containing protein n=1 Tax=Olpidium bornovanus TaxID=278681 RepID=A0A8H8DHP2_9FUNG|nr:MAG: hypothetical protein BJ554DRAFT_935 [Olpidium bornovanus]